MNQNQHKILLIAPPFYRLYKDKHPFNRYPLALGYLAGTIKKETNWDVMSYNADFYPEEGRVFDLSFLTGIGFDNYIKNLNDLSKGVWKEVKSTIQEYRPAVVGISANTQNFTSAMMVAKLAKKVNEQTVVIIGGPHPSMAGEEVLNCPDIDITVRGEGEYTLIELLNAIEGQKGFDNIMGIYYRKDGQVVENAPREYIEDLDSLCFPHESAPEVLKDYGSYPSKAFSNIFTTRGCPYSCTFCGSYKIWTRKVRYRSHKNIIREIKSLQKKGISQIRFDDDTFAINKEYVKELCGALITHCPGLKWHCEMHPKLVNDEIISLMKKAGCALIQIGVESGNNEILKKIKKNSTIEDVMAACRIIKKHGIKLQTFFIVGFPQETEDTLDDTVEAMKKVRSNYLIYNIFTPYPGTALFELCREKGLVDENFDFSVYNHQSPANHFCVNIPRERFRMLVSKIERMVDNMNTPLPYRIINKVLNFLSL